MSGIAPSSATKTRSVLAATTAVVSAGSIFLIGNVLILAFFVPWVSLTIFFTVSALLVHGRGFVGENLRPFYLAFSICALIAVLLLYHRGFSVIASSSFLTGMVGTLSGRDGASQSLLSTIGVSYCFLRSIYAVLDPRIELWSFTRYYFFSPTFFSGPVMRPDEYLPQTAVFDQNNVAPGLARMSLGAIKIVLSLLLQGAVPLTSASGMVDVIQTQSVLNAWFFAFSAGVWLFLNFSGFSDMCIGIARLCNIAVPENFNNPFIASDITDFWRRWHMTLAAWLRTCIYNPLTRFLSDRFGAHHVALLVIPPLVTMIVCGLWHGVSSGYLIWGALHGVGLVVHQTWKSIVALRLPSHVRESVAYVAAAWLVTHAYVALTWVFFFPSPSPSLLHSLLYITRMFGVALYEIDVAITNFVAGLPL